MVPSHEVFRRPLPVDLRLEDRPTPAHYRDWPGGAKLDKTIKVWRVQTRSFPQIDPGLVADPYGFGDSPDAEVISSGLNSKGPDSVALGRQGNFFLWGFSASPRDMTPEARKCFVNAVCYIRRFDGQKPLVRRTQSGREWALVYSGYLRQFADQGFIKDLFPEDLLRRFGKDPEKFLAYYAENLEYLRPAGRGFAVDEDVKGLGLSNRKVELLDACVAMLERGDRPELARRILGRYTTESFADAKGWRGWLESHRGRLFFTDVGGYKFLVAPESLVKPDTSTAGRAGADRGDAEPDARNPVVARAELSPAEVRAGDPLTLVVHVKTAPSWHIYSAEGSGGVGVATSLKLKLPEGIVADGDWSYPGSVRGSDGQRIYEGTFEIRRRLRVGADVAAGPVAVTCELGYQACDAFSCRPPTKRELEAKAEVVGPAGRP